MNRPIKILCLFAMAALAGPLARADVNLTLSPLNLDGWSTTIKSIDGTGAYVYGTGSGTVAEGTGAYAGSFKFSVPAMNTAWKFQWAGIGTASLAGTPLSQITSLKIRELGVSGDNANNWQPPSITLSLSRGGTSDRNLVWVPWTSAQYGTANPRASGIWNEYDCTTSGIWRVVDIDWSKPGAYYTSWAAVQAAYPTATLATTAQLPTSWGYASQQAVNVGMCPLYDEQRALDSNVTGYVDWFEIGINGSVTRYDLGAAVPEPGVLALLAVGLGLVALRKKA